jgi:hypothetical protein
MSKHDCILGMEANLGFSVGVSAQCSKNVDDEPIKWLHL